MTALGIVALLGVTATGIVPNGNFAKGQDARTSAARQDAELNPVIPFVAVTGRPTEADIVRKVEALKRDGYDQLLVYARSGLQYRYLGEDWLRSVETFCREADRLEMKVWLYDEYNWPSGTCKGRVPAESDAYRYSEWAVSRRPSGGYEWKRVLAPAGWVDVCSEPAMSRFVELTHDVYAKRLAPWFAKKTIRGIFTDEPGHPTPIRFDSKTISHFCRWDGLEEEYRAATGRDFRRDVEEYLSTKSSPAVWETYAELHGRRFRRNYFDRIAAWCRKMGVESTGHMIAENSPDGNAVFNGNPLVALKGESLPGMDEIGSRADVASGPEWLTLGIVQHAAVRNRNGGLVELYALGPNDMTTARLRQLIWLEAAHGVDHYLVSMQVMDHKGLVEKHGYLSPIQEGQPGHGEMRAYFEDAKKAARYARRLDYRVAAAVRYPQKATARLAYAGGKRPQIVGLLGAINCRQMAFDLVDEDEKTDRPLVFAFEADGRIRETSTGTSFADPAAAADWLLRRTEARVRYYEPDGRPATDLLVREYADGSSFALDLRAKGDRRLVADVNGARVTCNLPSRGVWALEKGELPPAAKDETAAPLDVASFAYKMDRDPVARVFFGSNRVARLTLKEPLKGVRFVLRDCALSYAITQSGRPVDELEAPPPGEKVIRHAAQPYSFELDGRPLVGAANCRSLPIEFRPLYRETEPMDLSAGEHVVRLVSGELDRNFFLPAAFVAGAFAAEADKLGRLPDRLRLGRLAEQGLGGYCGQVTFSADDVCPQGGVLRLSTGGLMTRVRWNGQDLGVRAWAPYEWKVPSSEPGRLEITLSTAVAGIFGDVDRPGAFWDVRFWTKPHDPEFVPGLLAAEWVREKAGLPPLPVAQPKYLPGPDRKVPVARQPDGGLTTGVKRMRLSAEVSRPDGFVSAVICPDLSHGRMSWLKPTEGRFASLEFRLRSVDPKKAGRLADAVKLTFEPAREPGVALVRYALDLAVAADMMAGKDGGRPAPVFDCRWSMPLDTPKLDFVAGRADMTVYPGDEYRELKVELPASVARAARIHAIRPAGRKGCEHLVWAVSPTAGESEGCLRIDLGNGRALAREIKPSYGPVDFDDVDALHVPVRPTRNLLANGGFEQGLKGWKMLSPCGVDLNGYAKAVENGGRCYEEIVDGAKFGRRCCHFKPVAPGTRGDQFSSPAQSVFPDRDYVLSFWAKSDGSPGPRLRSSVQCPRRFRHEYGRVSPAQGGKAVSHYLTGTALPTSEWRRFETAFRCTNGVVEVVFDGRGVFLDGVMLEEGVKATETADDPVVAHLVTASPENDLAFGRPFDARLELVAGAAAAGSLQVSVENYYRETVFEKTVDLGTVLKRRDAASPWVGEVPLDFDPARIGQGVFVVRYDFAADGKRWSDYERFTVTDFLDNAHPTAFFFLQYPYFQTHGSTGPRLADWMRTRGIGSTSWPRNDDRRSSPLKELYDTGKFRSGVHTLEHDLKYRYPKRFAIGTPGISAFTSNVTDEVVAFVEKEAYLSGSVCEPDDCRWALSNEEEAGLTLLRDKADFKSYARLQAACARGLRKAFGERGLTLRYAPTHGMCNYNPPGTQQCGKPADRRWSFERMLEEAGAIGLRYDFISMHMYGAVDGTVMMWGTNDRGENAAHLFATLRRYGYDDVPVRFEEGFNLLPFKVPAWGADGWADKFYSTPPSQAYGHTEFLHAGVIARQYLMDLSHWPRVETSHVWQHRPVMDFALTPWMWSKVSNTIGRLLPDPQGVAEAKPFPKMRAYVYRPDRKSRDGRGVLAIWTNDPDVENGVARSSAVTLDLPADAAFVDLMGNPRARPADGRVPLTPAPLFVLSANVYDLCRAICR